MRKKFHVRLYVRFCYFYLLFLFLCGLIMIVFYIPGMRETEDPSRTAAQFLMLLGFISLVLPIGFYLLCYRPLKKLVHFSYDCHSGIVNYPREDERIEEFAQIRENLSKMSATLLDYSAQEHNVLSNISHDFRSPLTSIMGYTTAILDGTIPPEDQDHYLKIVLQTAAHLSHMSDDIVSASRLDHGQMPLHISVFEINDCIHAVADAIGFVYSEKKIRLKLELGNDLPHVTADYHRIQQVLYNLLDNAVKFSNPGSEVLVQSLHKGNGVEIIVKDYGIGISPDALPRIWDRFYTTSGSSLPDRPGSGLGLAIVKEILNLHKQPISVRSTPGKGTEFVFSLEGA